MRRGLVRLACAALGGALLAAGACRAQVRDADMKAAYVYNFVQFTSWPAPAAKATSAASAALAVCAERASALGRALQSYDGRQAAGRVWQLVDLQARAPACDVLVLGRTEAAVTVAAGAGTLVIRDGAGAAPASAAAITLVDNDEHLQFDIDTREVARAGLRISSKLLRLARIVE
jgi:hypothetical protein